MNMIEEELGSIKSALANVQANTEYIREKLDEQNGRIRSLEVWRGYIIGIGAVVSVLLYYLFHLAMKRI